ncbi:MAG: DUF72 domain-containing protein [Actinobacteria bacterium]|nr:DUF72 domain-containing protein [Actinomycetota bacterium]MBU4482716.1 DUF72 domain-containing protein [Actinomycetota bacterium]
MLVLQGIVMPIGILTFIQQDWTKKTYIYFNNHYKAQAVRSAKILQELIEDSDISTSQN